MVHSSVASLFNLEYISTSMLWNCFHFSLPCQFTTSRFISSHTWKSCTPEHAMIATAVIFSLTFKPFSIFFYPLNCSFPNFFLPYSLCPILQFIPWKLQLCSAASLCQMLCQCKHTGTVTWPRMWFMAPTAWSYFLLSSWTSRYPEMAAPTPSAVSTWLSKNKWQLFLFSPGQSDLFFPVNRSTSLAQITAKLKRRFLFPKTNPCRPKDSV